MLDGADLLNYTLHNAIHQGWGSFTGARAELVMALGRVGAGYCQIWIGWRHQNKDNIINLMKLA